MPSLPLRFSKRVTAPGDLPPTAPGGELVLFGRSNVGKSSLLNALAKTAVARTSKDPGCTTAMTIYALETRPKGWVIDFPGYGYARRSKQVRHEFSIMIEGYVACARPSARVALLIDARRGLMSVDQQWLDHCEGADLPLSVIATKIDKIKGAARTRILAELAAVAASYKVADEKVLPVSARTGEGLDAVRRWFLRGL
ncbi:MAG: ribosome biogenesis GTP-binding protein YihA/YsxC [Pseudomonadota bacterium]